MAKSEVKTAGPEKISTTPGIAAPKPKNIFLASAKWGVFFFVFFLGLTYGLNYYLSHHRNLLNSFGQKQPVNAIDQNESELMVSHHAPELPNPEKIAYDATKPPENPAEAPAHQLNDIRSEINSINQKLTGIEATNRNLIIYFSARDLKEAIEHPENFRSELAFLRKAIGDNPDVNGNLDILEQATAESMVTRVTLLNELKQLTKKIETEHNKGFQANVENAIGNLVKVTKIEGEVGVGDYASILKRASLRLASDKLTIADLQQTISEMAKLGPAADDFIRHANSLKRIMEVTDYLVYYAKSKVAK